MSHLIEVSFKGNRREFFLWEGEAPPAIRAAVVVEADRGEDVGFVHSTGDLATRRAAGCTHGTDDEEEPTRAARRLATPEDLQRYRELRAQDESARRKAMERVKANALPMKLTDAEWRWDRRKLTVYFTAEKRVDFRTLVRELAASFRTRIELKQIGVRDEARRLGGIGRCGREYCSAAFLTDLRPVNLGVAKDQRLSLNPTQISGACGRLMCCLRFEHEFYVQQRKRFPKEGKAVTTARGMEKVIANDIFRERVALRGEDGETRIVPLAELRREMGVDRTIEVALDDDLGPPPLEGIPDEVIRMQDTAELPAWIPRPGGASGPGGGPPQGRPAAGPRVLPVAPSGTPAPPAGGRVRASEEPVGASEDDEELPDGDAGADEDADDGADEGADDGADDGADAGAGRAPADAASSGAPRKRRRRRGRRGGRRGRGGARPPDGAPPDSTPPSA